MEPTNDKNHDDGYRALLLNDWHSGRLEITLGPPIPVALRPALARVLRAAPITGLCLLIGALWLIMVGLAFG